MKIVEIRFIYSDDIADFKSEVNMDLYAIAHKYQLGRLQRICLEKLRVEVNVENVLHSLPICIKRNKRFIYFRTPNLFKSSIPVIT